MNLMYARLLHKTHQAAEDADRMARESRKNLRDNHHDVMIDLTVGTPLIAMTRKADDIARALGEHGLSTSFVIFQLGRR